MQELIDAIREENFDKARKSILSRGADVNYVGRLEDTPLVAAIDKYNIPMVEFLLEHGADIDKRDENGWTPVMSLFACILDIIAQNSWRELEEDSVKMLGFLVEQGADIDAVNNRGESLADQLDIVGGSASFYNHYVEYFEVAIPGLYERVTYRKEELEEFRYYAKGQHLPAINIADAQDQQTDKLHKAIYNGDTGSVQTMIDDGIDLHRRSHRGRYAVDIAISALSFDMLQLLVNNGLNVQQQYNGTTALHQALGASIKAGLKRRDPVLRDTFNTLVRLLLDNGAKMDTADAEGVRPIDLFAWFGTTRPIDNYSEIVSKYGTIISGLLNILEFRKEELMEYRAKKGK